MTRWLYHYAGLWVSSELELPEWAAFETPATVEQVDVEFKLAAYQGWHA